MRRARRLRDERALARSALWLAAACCLVLAACGEVTRPRSAAAGGNTTGAGGAGDSAGSHVAAAGAGDAGAAQDGSAGEGEGAAAAGAGGDGAGQGGGEGGSAGSGRPDGCSDLSHFEDTMRERWDLRVIGTGFEADEGSRVRLVITFGGEPSYGLGESTIENGSFDILLPDATEPYTGMGVYIDRDRDDACTIDLDSMWSKTTGGVYGEELWELTPDYPDPAGAMPCVINGIFDLTASLPCP